jgi:heat shock protein HslJ
MSWQRGLGGIAAVAVVVSCGQQADSGSGRTAQDVDADLLGRQFATQGAAGTTARLSFDADTVTANAGCNTLSGRAHTDSGRLFVDSMGGTEIGCIPALSKQDAWWTDLLASDPTYALDGATLQLATPNATVELMDVEQTHPDRPLAGTRWLLETLASGGQDGVASSPPRQAQYAVWLEFGDGAGTEVTGSSGCGVVRAPVEVTESSLQLGSVPKTRVCSDDTVQQVSRQVVRVLEGRVDYRIDGDLLTLTRGEHALVYRAASRG